MSERLSQSEGRVSVSDEIVARTQLYARHFPKAAHATPARHREMAYRVFLRLVGARLQATYDDEAFPYESPTEFRADIEIIADSLRANKGAHAGLFAVNRLLRRIDTFGFHVATLDLRQNALVHRQVVGEGLQEQDWDARTSDERAARIREALERRESPMGPMSSEARRTLAVFQAIAHCRRKYGPTAVGPYIVSMTHGADDVLSVLLLARWGDLAPKARRFRSTSCRYSRPCRISSTRRRRCARCSRTRFTGRISTHGTLNRWSWSAIPTATRTVALRQQPGRCARRKERSSRRWPSSGSS